MPITLNSVIIRTRLHQGLISCYVFSQNACIQTLFISHLAPAAQPMTHFRPRLFWNCPRVWGCPWGWSSSSCYHWQSCLL